MESNKIQINRKTKETDEKIKVIDIIIDMYPDLKKNKDDIINRVFEKFSKPTQYVFTKIMHNNQELYVDIDGLLLTKNLDFKGFVINNKYYMTSDIDNKNDILDISKLDRIIYN